MTYTTINSSSIEVGDPLKKELFDLIKDNFDDHEARLNALAISAGKVEIFLYDLVNGSNFSTETGLAYYQAIETFTITNAAIRIYTKGSLTGAVEIDIKKSTTNMDSASFTTIFTTKPKITYSGASDYDTSTNQVFNSGQISINPGDILRLDITEAPGGGVLPKLKLIVYGEP
jgi:hypothetical protein